ncbi:hypothetical protein FHW23_000661 [Curtobacterium pusillum]|uniref:Bacterial Ig-like domain-containing protein n=1 Tax=Curtobacterium pusillum TaxID=69373 RepID=A0AAW3T1L2_9MICO|nr:hypothetical protein [Curtobacterium pusillum]MBA8989429.1 hypothetical protein [Curtobacterium pusillum]
MGAFTKSVRVCGIAVLGFGLTFGTAALAAPAVASEPSAVSQTTRSGSVIEVTSDLSPTEDTAFDLAGVVHGVDVDEIVIGLGLPDHGTATVPVAADGSFAYTFEDGLAAGRHTIDLAVEGAVQDESRSRSVLLEVRDADGIVPLPDDRFTPVEVRSEATYQRGERLTVQGVATPGAEVTITGWSAGVYGEEVRADERDGRWSWTSSNTMFDATQLFTFAQEHETGSDSAPIEFAAVAEEALTPLEVESEATYVRGKRLTVEGVATPGAEITIAGWGAGVYGEKVTADEQSGRWSWTSSNTMYDATQLFTFSQEHRLGSASESIEFRAVTDAAFSPYTAKA